jgi:hypothetical protein
MWKFFKKPKNNKIPGKELWGRKNMAFSSDRFDSSPVPTCRTSEDLLNLIDIPPSQKQGYAV